MTPPSILDKAYNVIQKHFIETGHAPHYTEISAALGIPVEDARKVLHDLMASGILGVWLFPDTDYIGSFAPFSNLPTQYKITVGRRQQWFGQ